MTNDWPKQLDRAIDRHMDEMVRVRRHLHANPEPSGEEHATSLYLHQLLSDRGFEVQVGPEGRGVVADTRDGDQQGRIAIRADIDALKIQDRKDVPYRSQRAGVMHACGHDAHTAMVYGALVALQDLVRDAVLPKTVSARGVFQPSEETATGAREMIRSGAIQGVDAIVAVHVDPTRLTGRIGMRCGVLTANCDVMRMTIHRRGGRAARPHESNDPIAAAVQLISTLYLFVPRATDSQDAVVVTIGWVDGGDNPNVIPEHVELQGTLRTLDQTVRHRTTQHIQQLARGIEQISGTTIDVKFESSVHSVRNGPRLNDLVRQAAGSVQGDENLDEIPRPSMGSEDFAVYRDHVPGTMFPGPCSGSVAPWIRPVLACIPQRLISTNRRWRLAPRFWPGPPSCGPPTDCPGDPVEVRRNRMSRSSVWRR